MTDVKDEMDDLGKELAEAFDIDLEQHANMLEGTPAEEDKPKGDEATPPAPTDGKVEEPKKDEPAKPEDKKEGEEVTPPAADAPEEKKDPAKPETPETPPAAEEPAAPQPLTKDDVTDIITKMRNDDRISTTAVSEETEAVMNAYYPEGLSNVLVDQRSGKELKTPQDVVDASNGEMTTEAAAQWLINEQYKLDQKIESIRGDAQKVAETTLTFRTNAMTALQKYEPLFKAYPKLQAKVLDKMMKYVKKDDAKNVILSAPDPLDFYDDYLEPYQQAYEFKTKQSATNPTPAPGTPEAPETPPAPSAKDRMDEGGDGGVSDVDDPNNFAQQVSKELSNPF